MNLYHLMKPIARIDIFRSFIPKLKYTRGSMLKLKERQKRV